MSYIQLPQKIIYGMEAFSKIFDESYGSVLIISDGNLSQKSGALLKLQRKFAALLTECETIISDSPSQLFEKAKKYASSHIPEAIIAIGTGEVLDCGRAVSGICEIPLVTVPETVSCALSEFETLDPFLYRKSAGISILDPVFINLADSAKIAYEALGTACLALECAAAGSGRYVRTAARKSFSEIYKNILPAFRGEISARENLLYAMHAAYVAYINGFDYSWQSVSFRTQSFFSQWNSSRISILAVCITGIAEYLSETQPDSFFEISDSLGLTPLEELSASYLLSEIRRIQASLSVPFALKNFMIDEASFYEKCSSVSDEDKDLACRCYYGNITFIKS